jgi:hypothetical protein
MMVCDGYRIPEHQGWSYRRANMIGERVRGLISGEADDDVFIVSPRWQLSMPLRMICFSFRRISGVGSVCIGEASVCQEQPGQSCQEQRPTSLFISGRSVRSHFGGHFMRPICSVESLLHMDLLRLRPDLLNEKHRRLAFCKLFPHAIRQLIAFWIGEYQITRLCEFRTVMIS